MLNSSVPRQEAFLKACASGDMYQVRLMLSEGMPAEFAVNGAIPYGFDKARPGRLTPLIAALGGGHERIADLLLQSGAHLGGPGDAQDTPASWILLHGSDVQLDWLLAGYPDPAPYLPDRYSIGGLTASYVHRILQLRARGLDVLAPSRSGADVWDQVFIVNGSDDGRLETACATLVALGADTAGAEDGLARMLGVHFSNRLYAAVLLSDAGLTKIALEEGADSQEVLQPGGVTILQRIEGQEGDGTLWPYRQMEHADTQACADLIRAHIARSARSGE